MKPSSASLLTATLLLTDIATAAATCYRLDGTPFAKIRPDDGDWVPCDASASTSSCCSVKDYCLGNGLCLDAGANNYFSVQGCTDASWGSPCVTNAACKSNIRKLHLCP
ncbi:hypothetical protein CONLIGDRAFT_629717 [Coniochaeta ligniaria NRRL 30616]|uniref:Uncharacterized protein n=1 Tax=Coniochaeta ligniaria NRRL 30616 TaxID=1408157 RepID=A0A1J7JRM3_9PEZI|nr:hypothetical protein CONLIGDRAFT_629717 [Coniochaeta ligniaria NRRL 30616]